MGEVPRGTRTRPESTCAAATRAAVPHRSRHATKGRIDDTNTHERPGSDVLSARRGTCVDAGSPDRTLVRREPGQAQARRRRRRRGEQGNLRRRRTSWRLRGLRLGLADLSGERDLAGDRQARSGDVQPARQARRPVCQDGTGSPLPGQQRREVGAVRPAQVRPGARRDLVLGGDERHREPHGRARRRPGLHGEQVPRLGRDVGRRRLDDGQRPRAGTRRGSR